MIIKNILGNVHDSIFSSWETVYATMPFDHSHKRIQRLKADDNREFGLRLDEDIRVRGLNHDDVFFRDEDKKIQYAIRIEELPCLVVRVKDDKDIASIAYIIGNRHAKLYFGQSRSEFLTPYEKTLEDMLLPIEEVELTKEYRLLRPGDSLMSILPSAEDGHSHEHDHDHEHNHDHDHIHGD